VFRSKKENIKNFPDWERTKNILELIPCPLLFKREGEVLFNLLG